LSAYQVAQLNGFTGTETEWLASLEGDQGPQGVQGEPGADGTDGATGPAGPGVAEGGAAGQILAKNSSTDYDTVWIDNYANWTSQLKHEVKLSESIAKGQAVYVSSADGTNMIVSKASNASESTSSKTMGLLEEGGSTNAKVKVITEGLLSGLNTSTASAGDPVWLGTSGNLVYGLVSKPVAPAHLVFIGVVTRSNSNNGEIFVKPQNGFELDELHDVLISAPATGEVIQRTASNLWENKTLAEAGISAVGHTHAAADVTSGTFAIARIPTGSTSTTVALGNHNHTLDSLSNVTISSNASGELLKWNGTAWVNTTLAEAGIQPAGSYLTGNQTVTLSGDVTGSGATGITATLANSGVTAGTYKSVTVDAKGRVTAGTSPTTLAGYGITDAASSSHTHAASAVTSGTFDIARIPTGSTGSTVALGNHTHSYLPLSGGTLTGTLYISNLTISGTTGAINSSSVVNANGITSTAALTRSILSGGGSTTATFDNSGNLVRTASSERYKQDIEDAEYSYEEILSLQPKTFRLKSEAIEDENARRYGGFIAEEVNLMDSLKVFVNYQTQQDGSKIPDGINYAEMTSALVSALKHQDTIIKDLKSRIEILESK
jgi:hypothetical protein